MAKEKQTRKNSKYAKKLLARRNKFGTVTLKVPTVTGEKTITIVKPRPLYE